MDKYRRGHVALHGFLKVGPKASPQETFGFISAGAPSDLPEDFCRVFRFLQPMCREQIPVYSKTHTDNLSALCGWNEELSGAEAGGSTVICFLKFCVKGMHDDWLRPRWPVGQSSTPGMANTLLLTTLSREMLGAILPPIQWVRGGVIPSW
jgi:hypothetical protein